MTFSFISSVFNRITITSVYNFTIQFFVILSLAYSLNAFPQSEKDKVALTKAIQLYVDGKHKQAAKQMLKLAKKGLPDAQFRIAASYLSGEGVKADKNNAIKWFKKAVDQGHAGSIFYLGQLYTRDKTDVKKQKEGFELINRVAIAGLPRAQYQMGLMKYFAINTKLNRTEAKQWMEKAATNNYAKAVSFLRDNTGTFNNIDVNHGYPVIGYKQSGLNEVNLYAGADIKSPIITKIPSQTMLRVVNNKENFSYVVVPGGLSAWVHSLNVNIYPPHAVISTENAGLVAAINSDHPDNIIGVFPRGWPLTLLSSNGDWIRVQAPELVGGWIAHDTIDLKEPVTKLNEQWEKQAKVTHDHTEQSHDH